MAQKQQRFGADYILEGERVRLRPWTTADDMIEAQWPNYDDPLSTLWNIPRKPTLFDEFFSLVWFTAPRRVVWAIDDRNQQTIGRLSLRDIRSYLAQARLGISLCAPMVGKGLGSEALTLLLDHFFGPLGFHTMVLDVAALNRRAICCYERLGFRTVFTEWRTTTIFSYLPPPDAMEPYFGTCLRRERVGVSVKFLEMQLVRQRWMDYRASIGVVPHHESTPLERLGCGHP